MNACHWSRILCTLGCALTLDACSSFDREWRMAAARPAQAKQQDPYSGAWDGQWTSAKHRLPSGPAGGRLRCIFSRKSDTEYHAKFHADWLVFATTYDVDFTTSIRGKVLTFRGEHDLGTIFGGVYRYDGRVTPERFRARFIAKSDHGEFDMVPARDGHGD